LRNWKFPEDLPWDGFIVQCPVEDCWDGLGTLFFTERKFMLVTLLEAKPDGLFLSLWDFFHSILLGYRLVHELMETLWLEQVQSFILLAI
jgi:hypothetical protein